MLKMDYLNLLLDRKVVAIMRAKSSEQLIEAAEAIFAGGMSVIEVTMTTPNALDVIEKARAKFESNVLFGAGSVLDPETARAAILAGAQFIVCPALNLETIGMCKRYGIPVLPGAFTPTEVLTAWEHGADVVKVFPTSIGGPGYIKAIKAPLPQIRLAAVGGVNLSNTADFFRAGCVTVGIGGELLSQDLLDKKDFGTITERARGFMLAAEQGSGS
jgi:2-dehydro-3-deoxyphosphogluconate aldolase/(4S)-4-hydroxy-2-oxoglutarate aldolase